jgi:thioredoxin 2
MAKVRVLCPHCMNTNAVVRERMDQGPICGICKFPLLPRTPVRLNGSQFDLFITRTELPVLVNFGAPWCGHSRTMAPAFDAAAARMHPGVVFATVDTQTDQPLAARFAIQSTPTMVLFKSGMENARISGAMESEQIVSWLRTNLFGAR